MNRADLEAKEAAFVAWAKGLGRMGLWLVLALVGLVAVHFMAPQMVKVSLFKLTLMPIAAYVGYWIDRGIFASEIRPHDLLDEALTLRHDAEAMADEDQKRDMLRHADTLEGMAYDRYRRRALIVSAALIAVALGS